MHDVLTSTGTNLGPIRTGRRFTQSFVASADDLCGVSLWIATYHHQIVSNARFELLDELATTVLREVTADTSGFADNAWQRFGFEPIDESAGRTFTFAFSTDALDDAITLWTNDRVAVHGSFEHEDIGAAICHETHYRRSTHSALDIAMPVHAALVPEPPASSREFLHEIVRLCVARKHYYLLRLLHLLDAFDRTRDVVRVLSVGSGEGFHEAFLAARFSHLRVDGIDVVPTARSYDLPNLRLFEMDILRPTIEPGTYDFVFSIECLEHLEQREEAFRSMATLVKPGGYLYLSVPFASAEEQQSESLRQYVWEVAAHYTPGFDFATLDDYFASNGLDVIHASSMFECRVAHSINKVLHVMDASVIESVLEDVIRLFALDLPQRRFASNREAEGIRYLGRKQP